MSDPDPAEIRAGGKAAIARALAAVESAGGMERLAGFLDGCVAACRAHAIGLTGPPGVGKSTLVDALIRRYRASGESVAVLAVDPSSRVTGGALLGDRTRLRTDPGDPGVFVRSMAAGDRLGGLSDRAAAVAAILSAAFDRVIVESVGIGQSEADVSTVADTVVLCIQPGSGDSLQFMKAGVMEIPDVVAVTKADTGPAARRAAADVIGAVSLASRPRGSPAPQVIALSAVTGEGIDALMSAIDAHRPVGTVPAARSCRNRAMVAEALRAAYGRRGLAAIDLDATLDRSPGPFTALAELSARLERALAG
jgi:LAO/AO transport system kinase